MSSFDLEPGQTVSHFRMEKKLGEGGMGAVYLAEDLTLSRRVAIKFMSRSLLVQQGKQSVREGLEQRFIREAKSAAAINHPNIAQIYEANFDSDDWYIAMEFIDGSSLYDSLCDGKKFNFEDVLNICRQTVSGLDFAWENYKIVHRDIKPHNIMLTKNNLVKIVDLGLAKPLESDLTEFEMPDLTGAGTPIGTPQYMAPEQATGQKDISHLVDIFALGATLYEVITGKKAFSGSTAPMIYMSQVQKKYTPLRDLRNDTPGGIVNLVDHMLEPKPEDRISSYPDILQALNECAVTADDRTQQYTRVSGMTQASPTMAGHLSGKTVGMDQLTVYHATDKLIKDRYRILKPMGKSRAGMVYHCMDTKLSVECIVKSLFPGREYPEHEMPRIKENFQRLMGRSHPNLVQIRDLQEDEETGEFFVVMELLDGRDLREYTHRLKNEYDVIEFKTIEPEITLIAKALDSVSKTFGTIHHDLIPEDIYLLENNSKVKFLDYGITYPSPDDQQQIPPDEQFMFPLASPDYMSPELWQRKPAVRQSDQYSLAVIIYEIFTGKLPFWLKDPIDEDKKEEFEKLPEHERQLKNLYLRVISEQPKPLSFQKKHENNAIQKALSKDPHDRFSSCEAFAHAIANSGGIPVGARIGAIAAVAVISAAAIGFSMMKQKEEPAAPRSTTQAVPKPKLTSPGPSPPRPPTSESKIERPDQADVTRKITNIAMRSQESAEEKKLELERRQKIAGQQQELDELKVTFTELRQALLKDPISAEQLPRADTIIDRATTSIAQENYITAIKEYREAIAAGENISKRSKEIKLKKLLEMRDQANSLKKTYEEQRAALVKQDQVAARLGPIDEMIRQADDLLNNEQFAESIRTYRKAIDAAHDISNEFNKEMRKVAEELKPSAREWRNKLRKFKGLSAEITEQIVKSDVTLSLAREAMNREEFAFAVEQYDKAIKECQAILTLAEEKFNATPGNNFTDPKVGMDFIWIESLKLWVGKYEVTNGEFRRFKQTHDSKKAMGFTLNKDRQPVLEVSYYDAVGFCQWLNAVSLKDTKAPDGYSYRLPSREEWEVIARAGTERLYPWGNNWPPAYGNFGNQEVFPSSWQLDGYSDEFPVTCEVEKSGTNELGIYGLAGNVWEWTTELKDGKRAVLGGDWTSVSRATLVITVQGAYAGMDEPFDNIGFRILLAPDKE